MEELRFAKQLAREAGNIIVKLGKRADATSKRDGSPVTKADRRVNEFVISAIKNKFPMHAVMGEESSYLPTQYLGAWVCDPLDGTLPYTLGLPTCVFSLAYLNREGMPILAVVYDPYLMRLYWAVKGGGAFVDGKRLRVSKVDTIAQALIGNSGRSSDVIDALGLKLFIYKQCYRPIVLHSVIYESMLVASGKIAATILTGSGAHDAASAKLIVEESGGRVTDLFAREQRYDQPVAGAIISNGYIHDTLVNIAARYKR